MSLLNRRVRCVDSQARIFFKRRGRVVKVNEPAKYSKTETTFNVKFEHGDAVYGPFKESDLEVIPEEVYNPNDKRPQIERLMESLADDMDCWIQEALVAFEIARGDLEAEKLRHNRLQMVR